ncbi:homoserine acetyltransferase [Exidia glandulosa HHB12029]|uniref:Homoserine acetyltransferase n=1 Tax=Exidia glandulosa HHB12029 TaxID=1314781 RepID=A0A165IZI6_EXIGL|nr:homoserine acetyltransferase [Exidia glandulosa HHB12029]
MSALRRIDHGTDHLKTLALGDFELKSGDVLHNAQITYATFGTPDKPAIVNPTWYSGVIGDCFWLIGSDKALDPEKYFIIVPALFGNGESTSPTNSEQRPFPRVEYFDNVRAQRLLVEHLGVTHVAAVLGFSMGGQQTYEWAVQHPDLVDENSKIIPICSSARTSPHNFVFLEGPKSALLAGDKNTLSRKAFGRVWAGWGLSQAWYRARLWEKQGFKSLDAFLEGNYDQFGLVKDPDNLLVMLDTWQRGDVSKYSFDGNLDAALRSIKAKALILPCMTDLYFPPEDSFNELASFSDKERASVVPIPSVWGHAAGGQANPEDQKWVMEKVKGFLESK